MANFRSAYRLTNDCKGEKLPNFFNLYATQKYLQYVAYGVYACMHRL